MKSKRGILGTIILAVILALFIIGAFLYFQIRTKGIEFRTGNFIINIGYEKQVPNVTVSDSLQNETIENKTEEGLVLDLNNLTIEAEPLAEANTT